MASLLPNGFTQDHTKLNRVNTLVCLVNRMTLICPNLTHASKQSFKQSFQKGSFSSEKFSGKIQRSRFEAQLKRHLRTNPKCLQPTLNPMMVKIRYVNLCMMSLKLADSQEDISSEQNVFMAIQLLIFLFGFLFRSILVSLITAFPQT